MTREEAIVVIKTLMDNPLFNEVCKAAFNIAIHDMKRMEKGKTMIHNCSECDYCYTNDTMDCMSICVNGKSEMLGQVVDSYGMAEDDMDCVVIDGKDRDEIDMDDADAHWEAMDDIEREEWMRGDEDEKVE